MAYVEVTWRYEQKDGEDFFPIFLARSPLLSGLTNGYAAAELYAIGWRLVAVLPLWPGWLCGTSIWEVPEREPRARRG
jgi:hypothetical protein